MTAAPLYHWLTRRSHGVLLHPTSLPGDFGVGGFGKESFDFIDFLAEVRMHCWQVCPLGPTGYGDSPYQCLSSFAGNPYLIDPLDLSEHGLIPSEDLGPLLFLAWNHVDYGSLYEVNWPLLFQACEAFRDLPTNKHPYGDYKRFLKKNAFWLDAYSLFHALKQHHGGEPWTSWPASCRTYEQARQNVSDPDILARAEDHRILQYFFHGQWKRVRRYASENGIRIIGDVPIYASHDSADVWSHPEIFQVDPASGELLNVAGVPPDYFSETGQLWGNPLYNWDELKKTGYKWWLERLRKNFELYDIVRLDHFRGFHDYWSVPAGAEDAREGQWHAGPGLDFFKKVRKAFPDGCLIAEDLGDLSDGVFELRDNTGLPGMAILQFAFGGDGDNLYLPHHHTRNLVVYPGTHDNDTTRGWYEKLDESARDHIRRYLRVSGDEIAWDFIRAALRSPARLAIIPLQDLMNLGSEARMNVPGRAEGNWQWRFQYKDLEKLKNKSGDYLRELAELNARG